MLYMRYWISSSVGLSLYSTDRTVVNSNIRAASDATRREAHRAQRTPTRSTSDLAVATGQSIGAGQARGSACARRAGSVRLDPGQPGSIGGTAAGMTKTYGEPEVGRLRQAHEVAPSLVSGVPRNSAVEVCHIFTIASCNRRGQSGSASPAAPQLPPLRLRPGSAASHGVAARNTLGRSKSAASG
jgi:hypothetical protein